MNKITYSSVLFTFLISLVTTVDASQSEQKKLDKACESARQEALAPRKKEIYLECRNKYKKNESVCKQEADAYNGNRINGAPMYYELPACEQAFRYRKKHGQ